MTPVNFLVAVLGVLVSLSVASERLVEVIKGVIPFLNQQNSDAKKEGWRCSILQAMAVCSGILTALLAKPALVGIFPTGWGSLPTILALGLLASGGSGMWNGLLSWVLSIKNMKKEEFVQLRTKRLLQHARALKKKV